MIAKKIAKKADVADSFTRLGTYISAAPEAGEKLDRFWIGNCNAGETLDDLPAALAEIEAVRQKKPKVKDKTYHLVVSFRDSDRDKLTDAALKDIANSFVTALGFEGHQYVAGTHINTDNFHMHVGINKVHPQTHRVLTPFRDFKILERVSREMERKYGLAVDRGMSDRDLTQAPGLSPAAKDHEARTWEVSFQRWLTDNRATLLPEIQQAGTWQDLHETLARHRVQIKPQGAGMVFASDDGQTMKASAFDRSCSKAALEKRLGAYQPRQELAPKGPALNTETVLPPPGLSAQPTPPPGKGYRPRPLDRTTGTPRLWRHYRQRQRAVRRSGGLDRALRTWASFILVEAYSDPLAAVVLLAHREALTILLPSSDPFHRPARISEASLAALRVWRNATPWQQTTARPAWAEKSRLGSAGVKVDDLGNLIVPFRSSQGRAQGRIEGVLLVAKDGSTLTIGPVSRDSLHLIDPGRTLQERSSSQRAAPKAPVLVTADYPSAVALAQATGAAVAVARCEADLSAVAAALSARYHAKATVITRKQGTGLALPSTLAPAELRSRCARAVEDKAMLLWDSSQRPAGRDNPVLAAQGVQSYGCREDDTGSLLVPLRTLSGRLEGVAMLRPGEAPSQTVNLARGPLVAMIDPLRELGTDRPVLLAQDYPTAAALHRATRLPVLAVQDPADWQATAEAVKSKWPNASLVIAMDDTRSNREQAQAAGLPLVAPVTPSGRRVSYADLTQPKTAEVLRDTLADATKDAVWQAWRSGHAPDRTDHPVMAVGTLRRGVRISDDGKILVPLRNGHQRLSGVLVVSADGEPLHTVTGQPTPEKAGKGAAPAPQPLTHVVGGWEKKGSTGPVVVARSLAEAVTLHRETTATVILTTGRPEDLAKALHDRGRPVLLAGKDLAIPQTKGFDAPDAKQKAALRKALTALTLPMRQGRGTVLGRGM
ncbi:TraI/MobA(P) family conjugative relaxase [Novispirillum itersonii]|uniref:Phage/plasmid primase-like uncharacterized protein n=1 Tax=Novispirillum itersonii TaxID=189 RepID=A0A7X0DNY8_NOVIT|nr:TraI/MobA(P) family conjugative relaxase [Novispirillum itersonii]MBB6212490.1 phage/plasmid primase-like uncharacterized protein [Novispirillum itersonii]